MGERLTIAEVLAGYRARITRIDAHELAASRDDVVVVDTRDSADRTAEGVIPGAIHLPLSVLLWRADPTSSASDLRVADLQSRLVIVCNDGYSSSWAAATLVDLGFDRAGDLIGGHRSWVAAGYEVDRVTG